MKGFRYSSVCVLSLLFLLFTGCAGRTELNELLIVSAIGVDYRKDQTVVHFEVVNPGGTAGNQGGAPTGGSGGSVYTYTVSGETLYDAVEKARNILPRKLLFSHITSVIIGEKYAREKGIAPLIDFMERNHEVRDNVIIFVAKDSTAKSVLSLYTPIFKNPGESLKQRVKLAATSSGISKGIKVKDVVRWRYSEFRDPVIQGVEIMKFTDNQDETSNLDNIDANNKTYRISGVAIFNKDKMVGWFNNEETRVWALLNERVQEIFILTHRCGSKNGTGGYVVKNIESKVKPVYSKGYIKYVLQVEGKAILQEVTCDINVGDPNSLIQMEKHLNNELTTQIQRTVEKAQKRKLDVFGFGKLLYNRYPDIWNKREKNWDEEFSNVELETHVNITLESVGARVEPIHLQK
jgi:spore germination protein KC